MSDGSGTFGTDGRCRIWCMGRRSRGSGGVRNAFCGALKLTRSFDSIGRIVGRSGPRLALELETQKKLIRFQGLGLAPIDCK